MNTGNIFFVDPKAESVGDGLTPNSALRTIADALPLCVEGNGDRIIVLCDRPNEHRDLVGIDVVFVNRNN